MPPIQKIAAASILVALAVLSLKTVAWWITGSVALFSDGTESLVNLASASVAFLSIRLAARPPDARHPYGFHKAELTSALFGGALILTAGVTILWQAVRGLVDPQPITAAGTGLGLTLLASAINAVWCTVLLRQGRRLGSPALQADGRHLLADVLFSAAVVIGVLGATQTGLHLLDPLVAGLVAINIMRSGSTVLHGAWRGLIDEALPEDQQDRIRAIVTAESGRAATLVSLRTRQAGRASFAEIRLGLPPAMPLAEAARISAAVERALHQALPGCQPLIVTEPAELPAGLAGRAIAAPGVSS
ncbi:cation diffusion facilitator family transporter [Rhodobacteraceae bacterium HSP-20]|uniref:Cation diffusion facilitator family transporter n=1 Tax=Paragemmobacter amnigenus TaxID=2852097 RepID=A0ABS6J1M6_9RHOB|nr:cation diffusion facilitator family transporter [Rhodobacter amnigenus]MBU9697661.1 cation diffusion facilitator family transporter [Rhodobacter amnigenus]MBV4388888.1 cation diffusion facilitator family transporter [Rhodobacter amnigenus]